MKSIQVFFLIILTNFGCQTTDRQSGVKQIHFTHSPILGRVGAHKMEVWARTARTGIFTVRYGTEPNQLTSCSPEVATIIEQDNTGWVHITGLASNTKYYYQFVWLDPKGEFPGPKGTFHTLPSPDNFRHSQYNPEGRFNFRFEFACGNNQNTAKAAAYGWRLPTYATMLKEFQDDDGHTRVDFAILNGDWLYEEQRQYKPEDWLTQVGFRNRRPVFRGIALKAWYDYLGWSNPVASLPDIRFGRAIFNAGSQVLTDPDADFSQLNVKETATLHVHWGTPDAGVMQGPSDDEGGDPNSGVYQIVEVIDTKRLRIWPAAITDGTAS